MLPNISEYIEALYPDPPEFNEELQDAELTPFLRDDGSPHFIAGGYGCVFKLHSNEGYKALKCFTVIVPHKQMRMEAIARRLQSVQSPYIVHYRYLPQELWVNSAETTWYDVLLMEWVEGKTLGEAVREHATAGNRAALQQLAANFMEMGQWLLAQDFAHGDLKHDNILVRPDGSLALIDYDGMYVPALQGYAAENKGVEEYQHPMRTLQNFNAQIDDYSIAVIAAALLALAEQPDLYTQYGNADRLLFSRTDLLTTTAPLLQTLRQLNHPTINQLLTLLQESIVAQTLQLPGLAQALQTPTLHLPPTIAETQNLIAIKKQEIVLLENHLQTLQQRPTMPAHMKFIKGGTFDMGDVFGDSSSMPDWYGDREKPVHRITVGNFYMSAYCVTFEEYDEFCVATGRQKPDDEGWGRGNRPVIDVSWYDAVEYCNWLSRQQGLTPVYTITGNNVTPNWNANGYRLPTEAEWEYAAREGGKKVRFGNGQNTLRPTEANFDASQTVPVNSFTPNALGLYNMSGNVWEWCQDWYDGAYYKNSPKENPRGPASGSNRVLRGGSWSGSAVRCRVSYRDGSTPTCRSGNSGFRVALVP